MLLVVVALMWSSAGVLIKLIPWHPLAIAGARSAIAVIVFLLVVKKPKFTGSPSQIGAAVAYAVTVTTLVVATKMTTAANAVLLQYTAPIYVAFFSAWFLKERITRLDIITVVIVFGGMILFFLDELSLHNFVGNLYGVISGISFGAFAVLLRTQKDGSPLESVLLGNLLTSICSVFILLRQPAMEWTGWVALLALGVLQMGIPYILYCLAIKSVTALDAVLIPIIEPILNPVWVFLMLGEAPGPRALLGGVLVLCMVTMRCLLPLWQRKNSAGC
ncbi:MAG: DMT family transporter [Firmicutes bacterium]|nr:DMT family transporter [Bacillota bacterium]